MCSLYYLYSYKRDNILRSAKLAIDRFSKRESLLFSQNQEGTMKRTNNGMEILFRKVRRNVRKRCGNIATGNVIAHSGESLLLFQNVDNQGYRDVVFGKEDMSEVFASDVDPLSSDSFFSSFKEFNMFLPPNFFFSPFLSKLFIHYC